MRSLKHLHDLIAYSLFAFVVFSVTPAIAQEKTADQSNSQSDEEERGSGIYKSVDKNGKIIFTDQPSSRKLPDVEEVELKDATYYEQPKTQTLKSSKENKDKDKEKTERIIHVSFTSPINEAQIGPATKTLNVQLQTNRYKPHYYQYRLYWNQQAISNLSPDGSFNIPLNLKSRGKRSLYAELVDIRTMAIKSRSNTINVYVIRP